MVSNFAISSPKMLNDLRILTLHNYGPPQMFDWTLEARRQFRLRGLEGANRSRRELERRYRECGEILAGSPPRRVVGDLPRVKAKLQYSVDFFAKPEQMDRAEE